MRPPKWKWYDAGEQHDEHVLAWFWHSIESFLF